ncbi:Hypothetical protein I596_1364 [Dokdonella koreensis DS-123]|uniref:Uncharacterized protein n=1 Tax=Dokdonella koreensis DS-123 TaxID=1300342 RepID=A0A167GS91_9GAMM|nr:Hypothetical protein I596_1364 [Dokdonella koreensis DS-123]
MRRSDNGGEARGSARPCRRAPWAALPVDIRLIGKESCATRPGAAGHAAAALAGAAAAMAMPHCSNRGACGYKFVIKRC